MAAVRHCSKKYEERLSAARPHKFAWERQAAEGKTLADLDEKRIKGAVRLGVDNGRMSATALTETVEDVLKKWDLQKNGQPTNGAVALFGKQMDDYPQLMMRMARFKGVDKSEFVDNQRVEGNFFDLLDAGMAFLFKHLSLNGKIVGFEREETLEIPAEALREALTNALCHRQYEKYNLSVGIAIYDDRIEIENPGRLPRELTLEDLKKPHNSYPYNLKIAKVLYMCAFLESWGSGVKRMMDLCAQHSLPEPEFHQQGGFVMVCFKKEKLTEKLTENQRKIVEMMKADPYVSLDCLAEKVGISRTAIINNTNKLKERNVIARIGEDKGGRWEVLKG